MRQEKEILTLNAFDQRNASTVRTELRDALARRMHSFGSGAVLFYEEPIQMVSAEGVWMYDSDGQQYLDVYNNVPSVGHSHPRVVEAIRHQVGLLNIHTR
jgi:4-aminobutyrate aminotransferase-like enzyme